MVQSISGDVYGVVSSPGVSGVVSGTYAARVVVVGMVQIIDGAIDGVVYSPVERGVAVGMST